MRREDRDLDVPVSLGGGAPTRCDTWVDKWVEIPAGFTGSLDVEGRLSSGSAGWVTVGTGNGGTTTILEVRPLFYELRINTTNVTGGTPAAHLVGLDRRTA